MLTDTSRGRPEQLLPHQRSVTFRPDIEGLRGIAVFVVVAFHCGMPGFNGGFVGVDVFFVLSGYLITGLLLAELERTGRVDFVNFYARRARRLLPASALVAFSTMCFAWALLSPDEIAESARAARASAVYLSNVFFAINSADYFAADVQTNPFLHTWSLSVEEQFYFFWPLVLTGLVRISRHRFTVLVALCAIAAVSFLVCLITTETRPTFAFYQLPARAWEFALGGIASQLSLRSSSVSIGLLRFGRACGLLMIMVAVVITQEGRGFPGWTVLLPVGGTLFALVTSAALLRADWAGWLETRPMQWLGRHSYGWYLWHWPLLIVVGVLLPSPVLGARIAAGTMALALAVVSLRWVENPLRYSRFLSTKPVRSIALAAALCVVGLGVSRAGLAHASSLAKQPKFAAITLAVDSGAPKISRQECLVEAENDHVKRCEFGSSDTSAIHVVLFGDSHAMHWFDPVVAVTRERSWRLTTVLKSGCPATGITLRGKALAQVVACDRWRVQAIADIRALDPDIILVANAIGYLEASGRPAPTTGVTLSDWEQGAARTMAALSWGPRVLWLRDVPLPPFHVPRCLARTLRTSMLWFRPSCDVRREEALPAEIFAVEARAARAFSFVTYVDLSDTFCDENSCAVVIGDKLVYRDDNHLNAGFAEGLKVQMHRVLMATP